MKKIISLTLAAVLALSLAACTPATTNNSTTTSSEPVKAQEYTFKLTEDSVIIKEVMVPSREIQIPATLTLPKGKPDQKVPLVVMNHGHGGNRSENGGFDAIAMSLAEKGIASIRMDFAGCGESTEGFRENNIFSMTVDSNAALKYVTDVAPIDSKRMGIFGYSMGGRIALEIGTLKNAPYKAIGLLAPSADDGGTMMVRFLGGQANYDKLYAEAATEKRYTTFTTQFGQKQELSMGWFEDMKMSRPLSNIANFSGDMLVVYGSKDQVVSPEISKSVSTAAKPSAKSVTAVEIEGSDHGYGFYDAAAKATKDQVVKAVADFFAEKL